MFSPDLMFYYNSGISYVCEKQREKDRYLKKIINNISFQTSELGIDRNIDKEVQFR